ncbi:MAG: hypothetical protein CMI52_04090 [Parcubacteria group bacterium]|nr:hypothetical protein [Parcubacteria group bacterium]|tara:strand:+ start:1657 stop:2202 length:546 start_codon:yes stop_codon:yes gene_type:complete
MSLERWLRELLVGLIAEKRWKGRGCTDENVLMHAFKMSWVVQFMLALEEEFGDLTDIRKYVILQAANNHDIGESVNGDVLFDDKTEEDEREEVEAYQKLMRAIVPADCERHFPLPPDGAPAGVFTDREIEFWDVCEKVGYLLFIVEEVRLGHPTFSTEEKRWRDWLENYRHYAGVCHFLDQ